MNIYQPSSRTSLGWVPIRFFTTTPCTIISDQPRHGGYNIPYHGTHCVESLYNLLYLSKAINTYSPPTLRCYILDLSSRTHQWQSGSPLWISIHVNKLQNKSLILHLFSLCTWFGIGLKIYHSDETTVMFGNRVDSCWCDISARRLDGGVWT